MNCFWTEAKNKDLYLHPFLQVKFLSDNSEFLYTILDKNLLLHLIFLGLKTFAIIKKYL